MPRSVHPKLFTSKTKIPVDQEQHRHHSLSLPVKSDRGKVRLQDVPHLGVILKTKIGLDDVGWLRESMFWTATRKLS